MIDYPDFTLTHEYYAQQATEDYEQTNANVQQNFHASEASIALLIENDAAPPIEEAHSTP
ncbi:MAG: hypothetical protein ACTJLL_02550 [Anaplasma sp.]